jgi:AcrR family transcriptional regulator
MAAGHRDALREAARVLLRRRGLRATTARDLVEESGTNLASIGYHFGSKDALMAGAVTDLCRDWVERPVVAAAGAEGDPGEALSAAIREMLRDVPRQGPEILAFLEAVVASGRGEPAGEHLAASSRSSLDAVAAAVTRGTPGAPPPLVQAAAAVLIALHDGLALLSTVVPERTPGPDDVVRVLAAFGTALAPVVSGPPQDPVP